MIDYELNFCESETINDCSSYVNENLVSQSLGSDVEGLNNKAWQDII